MHKFKEAYLVFLIVIALISLALYSTYAMFSMDINTNDIVSIDTTIEIDTSIDEYQVFTMDSYSTKNIELKLYNGKEESVYYGVWYEVLSGKNYNLKGYKINTSPSATVDIINIKEEKNVSLAFINNTNKRATVKIGIITSKESSLNLSEEKSLITEEIKEDDVKTNTIKKQIEDSYTEESEILYYDNENLLYYGTNPNNYMIFNDLLWRILGTYNGKVRIISDKSIGKYIYDVNGKTWERSELHSTLNHLYYEAKSGSCYKDGEVKSCDLSDIGLSDIAKAKINMFKVDVDGINTYNIDNLYSLTPDIITSADENVAILSLTEYIKSFNCKDEDVCLNESWLTSGEMLLLTKNGDNTISVNNDGSIKIDGSPADEYQIKPIVELKDDLYIDKGEGTRDNPYVLK